jgi:hypothetical protein
MAENPFVRPLQATKRPDYHALNDGSDDEAETTNRIAPPPSKRPSLTSSLLQASNHLIE